MGLERYVRYFLIQFEEEKTLRKVNMNMSMNIIKVKVGKHWLIGNMHVKWKGIG